jgi:hypothetical protein
VRWTAKDALADFVLADFGRVRFEGLAADVQKKISQAGCLGEPRAFGDPENKLPSRVANNGLRGYR